MIPRPPRSTLSPFTAVFRSWLTTFHVSGGCGTQTSNGSPTAPAAFGGTTNFTWTVTKTCKSTRTCSTSYTVTAAPAVSITCAQSTTLIPCQTQTAVNPTFAT